MRRIQILHAAVMLTVLCAGPSFAQAPAHGTSTPVTRLEARVAALERRLAIAEASLAATVGNKTLVSSTPPAAGTGAPLVYFEVVGPSAPALKSFYSDIFAWNIDANATIAAASTGGVRGGVRQDPHETLLYVGVPNIDQTLKQIEAAGGKTIVARTVVPGVVTFAIFLDPAGNRVGLAESGSYK